MNQYCYQIIVGKAISYWFNGFCEVRFSIVIDEYIEKSGW